LPTVKRIFADVRKQGDRALLRYAAQFDGLQVASIVMTTCVPDRAAYLRRPDLGRRLSDRSRADLELARACAARGYKLRLAEKSLCTDNAAMIGILAGRKLAHDTPLPALDEEIRTSWELA